MRYTHILTGKEFNKKEIKLLHLRCNNVWGNLTGDWDSYPYFEEWLERSINRKIIRADKEGTEDESYYD